jgi:YD repeat-containing protein
LGAALGAAVAERNILRILDRTTHAKNLVFSLGLVWCLRWRMQVGLPRNQVMPQGIRGFESLPLRHSVLDVAVLRDGLGAGWKISGASAGFGAVGHPPQLVAHLVERCHGSTVLYREEILLRDKLGRIEDRRETIGGVATDYHYEYDAAGRLEQVFMNSTLQTTYGYHANGARTSKTSGSVTSGTYDAQDRIQTWGALTFTHTANGERSRARIRRRHRRRPTPTTRSAT